MYTISFELAGFLIVIILLIVHIFLFDNKQRANYFFHIYTVSAAFECALDVFTAKIVNREIVMIDSVSIVCNTIYFMVALMTACLGYRMVAERLNHEGIITKYFAYSVLALGELILVINGFTGILFTIQDGQYIKTDYFVIFYALSFLFLALIPFSLIVKRGKLTIQEKLSPYFFIFVLVVTFIIQMSIPDVLLTGFGKALAAMFFCLYLETPEHIRLKEAAAELKKTRIEQLRTVAELDEANKQKTEFLVKMSHELRTPINAILGFDEIIRSECKEEAIAGDAVELAVAGERLLDIVERIVDFSQIETGTLELREKEYEFTNAYIRLYEKLEKVSTDSGLRFLHEISTDIPKRLYGDEKRISQILEELIKISVQQSSKGELILKISVDHVDDNLVYLNFCIINTGQKKMLLKENEENDLGYLIIGKILECMGGNLEYSFDDKDGEKFGFTLAQEIVDLKEISSIDAAIDRYLLNSENDIKDGGCEQFIMPSANILVVDDIEINLAVFEGLISQFRVNLTMAHSGKEAIEYMKTMDFDLVFMDILMPEMDGVETLHKIREDSSIKSKDAVVVALTANVFLGARDKYIADGFSDYITKPVNKDTIAKTLKTFLPDKIEAEWAELDITDKEEYEEDIIEPHIQVDNKKLTLEDIPGLDVAAGMAMCMDDLDLYIAVLKDYCTDDIVSKLEEFFANEDWENYKILIHGTKSTSKTVGLDEISEGAKALETAAKENDIEFIRTNHKVWLEQYINVIRVMEDVCITI